MRIELRTAMLAAIIALTALPAAAEIGAVAITHDPLMKQIMSRQLIQPAGGVTGSVRLGSGESITLSFVDPLAPLKPAEGLAVKPPKRKHLRKAPRADAQLKKMAEAQRRADWK